MVNRNSVPPGAEDGEIRKNDVISPLLSIDGVGELKWRELGRALVC